MAHGMRKEDEAFGSEDVSFTIGCSVCTHTRKIRTKKRGGGGETKKETQGKKLKARRR